MKVAILSMQKVVNYGSFMQAFALRKTIEALGHECEYLDIEKGIQMKGIKRSKILYLKKFYERFVHKDFLKVVKQYRLLSGRFRGEFFGELGALFKRHEFYDAVVIGSDEVFNFAQPTPWGFTEQLYGRVRCAEKVLSYAGSFGHTTMEDIDAFDVRDKIANAMSRMSSISVRDANSRQVVESLLGKSPEVHVDPVFIYDFSSHIPEIDERNYIVVYTYPNRISDDREIEKIVEFARKENKKIISIGFFFPWCDEVVTPHPFEVLSYFKNADYIITDTFHGTIFSIIMNRKFGTIIRRTNSQKLTSLLATMRLSERIVSDVGALDDVLKKDIDYSDANQIVLRERERSIEYLEESLT